MPVCFASDSLITFALNSNKKILNAMSYELSKIYLCQKLDSYLPNS